MTNQRKRCPLRMLMQPFVEQWGPDSWTYQCVEEACEWFIEADDEEDEGRCAVVALAAAGADLRVVVEKAREVNEGPPCPNPECKEVHMKRVRGTMYEEGGQIPWRCPTCRSVKITEIKGF